MFRRLCLRSPWYIFSSCATLWDTAVKFRFSPTNHTHWGIALKKSDDCQTDSEDWFLCFRLAQQPEETLAVLYEISPTVTLKRGEKSRRNKDLSKFLEIEIPLLKSVNFCFTLITFGRWSAMRELLHHSNLIAAVWEPVGLCSGLPLPRASVTGGYWAFCLAQPWGQPCSRGSPRKHYWSPPSGQQLWGSLVCLQGCNRWEQRLFSYKALLEGVYHCTLIAEATRVFFF